LPSAPVPYLWVGGKEGKVVEPPLPSVHMQTDMMSATRLRLDNTTELTLTRA